MTKRDNDLDAILEVLMFNVVPIFKQLSKNAYGSENLTKNSLKDALTKLELEDWVFDKYLDKLEKDEYIKIDNKSYISITNKGENFKIKEGGFRGVARKEQKEKDRKNKEDWILNFDRRWKLPAAILLVTGIIIAAISLNNNNKQSIPKAIESINIQKENIKPQNNTVELSLINLKHKTIDSLKLPYLKNVLILDKGIYLRYNYNDLLLGGANIDSIKINARTYDGESLKFKKHDRTVGFDITKKPYIELEYKGSVYSIEILRIHSSYSYILRKNIFPTLSLIQINN
jgi:hypothetical protein